MQPVTVLVEKSIGIMRANLYNKSIIKILFRDSKIFTIAQLAMVQQLLRYNIVNRRNQLYNGSPNPSLSTELRTWRCAYQVPVQSFKKVWQHKTSSTVPTWLGHLTALNILFANGECRKSKGFFDW